MLFLWQVPKAETVNYEVELGVIIGKKCKKISESHAIDYIGGYCLALDMTNVTQIVSSFVSLRLNTISCIITLLLLFPGKCQEGICTLGPWQNF